MRLMVNVFAMNSRNKEQNIGPHGLKLRDTLGLEYREEEMKHRVLIHAVCEITISNDDPTEAQAISEILFRDDISSKTEMFSVRVERVEVEPLGEPKPKT